VGEQAGAVGVDPSLEAWPASDERFVGDVDDLFAGLVASGREQPRVDEAGEDLVEAAGAVGLGGRKLA
jgi:hypothetical protein